MVKGHIPDDTVEEIRSKTDIVSLISGHINLKKAGRNYLGLCPFHKEKTPSFTVSPDKQIYYCFGCGEGGNAVSFVMKSSGMTFPEALRHLAARAGVVIPERAISPSERETTSVREQLIALNRQTVQYFTKNLFSATGKNAQEYLHRRGLSDEAVKTFRLGYAFDGWRHLRDFLQRGKASLVLAEQAGLLIAKEDGSSYDRFRGRLIFPIDDANGRTIAFGGRLIGDGEPKYLNSPESPVYIKGRNLYGLNVTKEEIRKKGFAVVVEGYFDLISLWNTGVKNVVATLGTALTPDHVTLLRRYTSSAAVVFDPDEAGKKALARSLALFLSGGVHMKAVVLPDGYDPDDFARAFGKEKFEAIVDQAGPAVEYYIDTILGTRGSLEHERERLKEAISFIARIDSVVERNLFVRRIAERLGVDEGLLKNEVASQAKVTANRVSEAQEMPVRKEAPVHIDAVELSLILMMLSYPRKIDQVKQSNVLAYFVTESLKTLGENIQKRFAADGSIEPASIIDSLADGELRKRILGRLVEDGTWDVETLERVFSDTVIKIKKKWYKEKHRLLKMHLIKAQEAGDFERINQLLMEKARLSENERACL
ncbi:MAG: DNA primase [Syntrophus sp. SKADARSKE-3]|nr:DNA primase [Syntrophus sp. SKADARSKE-3]